MVGCFATYFVLYLGMLFIYFRGIACCVDYLWFCIGVVINCGVLLRCCLDYYIGLMFACCFGFVGALLLLGWLGFNWVLFGFSCVTSLVWFTWC